MTISTTATSVTYTGNGGTTTWSYTFPIPALTDLVVQVTQISTGTTSTIASNLYTATGIGLASGGNVTYPLSGTPLSTDYRITISRVVPYVQSTDLTNQSALYADVIEAALDYLTMQTQQLAQSSETTMGLVADSYWDADGFPVSNLGAPVASSDAVRLTDLQTAQIAAGNVPAPGGSYSGKFLKALSSTTFGWTLPVAADISDSTSVGRSVLTAVDAAAARTAIGAASSAGTGTLVFIQGYSNTPPVSPSTNDKWAVAVAGTGAWSGHNTTVATWGGSSWTFATPDSGSTYVDQNTGRKFYYVSSAWLPDPADPAGRLIIGLSNVTPAGCILADGTAQSRTISLLLFQALVRSATITVTIASPGVVTWTAHALRVNDPVIFTTTGALPTGITAGTTYYVRTVVNANSFQISASAGGSVINTSGSQSGVHTGTSAPWGLGDGSTTFGIPNLGGYFIRGLDNSAGVDSNRVLGVSQADAFKDHTHTLGASSSASAVGAGANTAIWYTGSGRITGSPSSPNNGGTETRPKNQALVYYIRY